MNSSNNKGRNNSQRLRRFDHYPPKTTSQGSYVKVMISMD